MEKIINELPGMWPPMICGVIESQDILEEPEACYVMLCPSYLIIIWANDAKTWEAWVCAMEALGRFLSSCFLRFGFFLPAALEVPVHGARSVSLIPPCPAASDRAIVVPS